jgi:hypothetical protein
MIFIEEKESHLKWVYLSQKGKYLFYFRKDASKYLNQILKKQQVGNSKAGLGMNASIPGFNSGNMSKSKFTFSSFTK